MGAVESPDGEAPVVVLDISAHGVLLQADSPPDPAVDYQLYFTVHHTAYSPKIRVVHWAGGEGAYRWGCVFFEIPSEQVESLQRTVHAAAGQAEMSIRRWDEVSADASSSPAANILVGTTPSGRDICIPARDCLEIGRDGIELFVQTVAGLETA